MTVSRSCIVIVYGTSTTKSIIISYKIAYKGSLYFGIPGVSMVIIILFTDYIMSRCDTTKYGCARPHIHLCSHFHHHHKYMHSK
jgi:hypothetical protein